ncbi:MAG: hypothetical protein R3F40_08815 [Candidatus Competibacteraceae bacterium]
MMKALFAHQSNGIFKEGMDYLKVGVTLRIPTLREIVDHTGSKVAKQLLEQQAAANQVVEPEGSSGSVFSAAGCIGFGWCRSPNRNPSRCHRPPLIEDRKTLSKEAGLVRI